MAYTYKRCGIVKVAEVMAPSDQEALLRLIESSLTGVAVANVLREFGYSVNHQVVLRHRRRECSCQ